MGHFQTIFKNSIREEGGGFRAMMLFLAYSYFELFLSLWTMHVAHAVCAAKEYLQGFYERFVDHLL